MYILRLEEILTELDLLLKQMNDILFRYLTLLIELSTFSYYLCGCTLTRVIVLVFQIKGFSVPFRVLIDLQNLSAISHAYALRM